MLRAGVRFEFKRVEDGRAEAEAEPKPPGASEVQMTSLCVTVLEETFY